MVGVDVRDVTVRFGSRTVVDSVTVDLRHGEILALVGPNGCGKSTLLSVMTGTRAPDSGSVSLDGSDVSTLKSRELARRRSVVMQHNSVTFAYRVEDVVAMGRAPWSNTPQRSRAQEAVDEAIASCDLERYRRTPVSSLSGGEQARVALARALAQEAPVMFLDEPTAALDIHHQEEVLTILAGLRDQGRAVLIVLHDLTLAAAYADRVAVMNSGRITALGTPTEVLTPEVLSENYAHPIEVFPHPETGYLMIHPQRSEPPSQ
jgi:iron complex transport system ATP-binding protein